MPLNFAPSDFEVPKKYRGRFQFFGMGEEAAKKLAVKLNLTNPHGPIVIFGSAGALNPSLKVGQCFLVSKLFLNGQSIKLPIPNELNFLPQAKVVSAKSPVKTPKEKKALFEKTGADLVDCEIGPLWDGLSEPLKDRFVFIRGVIDGAKDRLGFLEHFRVRWLYLLNPFIACQFIKFLFSYGSYLKGMENFIDRLGSSSTIEQASEISEISLIG